MFEVILGLGIITVLLFQGYSLFLIRRFDSDSAELEAILLQLEGKVQLSLEKIDAAVAEIEPPSVGEHIAGIANMWMQGRMMDRMQGQNSQHLNEPTTASAEAWPADVPPVSVHEKQE